MMNAVLDRSLSSAVTQADKAAARHLRDMLVATHGNYQSAVFDILQMAHSRDRALAEISFLIGMQTGYELGIAYRNATEGGALVSHRTEQLSSEKLALI